MIENAMYAPSAKRSLISFKDLRANGIHTLTTVISDKEALELRRRTEVIATAYAGPNGLYELPIGACSRTALTSELPADAAKTPLKVRLWHRRMGHPGTTMFRRMLPILSGHEVCLGDANKIGVYSACAQ